MHSVMESDKETIEDGKVIADSINHSASSFTPDLMYEQLVKDYSLAENIYGEKIIAFVTGYDGSFVKKNVKIPEFQREIKKNIGDNLKNLQKKGYLEKDGSMTDKAIEVAALINYIEEVENVVPKGSFGDYFHKKASHYGEKSEMRSYKKGDRYRDISVKGSVKLAIRRGHSRLAQDDLKSFDRSEKGTTSVIYGIDASGSMQGKKIAACKRSGIALAFRAIDRGDSVGLVVFKDKVDAAIAPTRDFFMLLRAITAIRASQQTDFVEMIEQSADLFPSEHVSKHLIILSDALPTATSSEDTLRATAQAASLGITISIIGISLDRDGIKLAKKVAEIGNGKFYIIKDLDQLGSIVMQDYYELD